MTSSPSPTLAASIAAAQLWWRDAGVEFACGDEATPWLREEPPGGADPARPIEPMREEPPAPPPPRMGGDPENWPNDLPGFAHWWMQEPSLDPGGFRPKLSPRGAQEPALMVLVPMPEADDGERLLGGAQGRLIEGIAAALSLGEGDLYLAAALPRHMPVPDWAALDEAGLGTVLRHHVALARPRRLLVMGNGILPLMKHGLTQATPDKGEIAIQDGKVPLLGTLAPEILLGAPRSRAALWRQLLDWTEADAR